MSRQFSTEASVVALYGLQFSPNRLEACYRHIVEWFDSRDCHPDRLGVSGVSFDGRIGTFGRTDKRLQHSGFAGIRGFGVYRLVPGGDIPGYDWCVSAEVSEQDSFCIVGARSSVAPIPGASMFSMTRTLIQDITPVYGIGFRREMDLGPCLYGMGGCMGLQPWGAEKPEAERIVRWRTLGIEQRCYEKGLLRDVYPWNFLTQLQLSRQVEGVSLRQWIEQDQKRGSLSTVEGSMWLWEVDEGQMTRVRSALESAGVLFDVTLGVRNQLGGMDEALT